MDSTSARAGQGTASASRNLWIGASLAVFVAVVLSFGVIPTVKADLIFHATPKKAALVLWFVTVINLALAVLLSWAAMQATQSRPAARRLLGWWGIASLLLAFLLVDPAFAYFEHDTTAMKRAGILLLLCAVAELLGAGLALFTRARKSGAQSMPP